MAVAKSLASAGVAIGLVIGGVLLNPISPTIRTAPLVRANCSAPVLSRNRTVVAPSHCMYWAGVPFTVESQPLEAP